MKINYGYFRHRFDAHNDPKLQKLAETMGMSAYGYFYVLLELYGAAYSSLSSKEDKVILHIRSISTAWRQRSDYCLLNLSKLAATGLLRFSNDSSMIELDIPNFPKYFGSYDSKSANKRKEKEIKENKIIIEAEKNLPEIKPQDFRNPEDSQISKRPSPLSFLFSSSPEIQAWLNDGIHETHMMLLKKYSHHELVDLIEQAFAWAAPRGTKAESWLYTFVSNKNTAGYGLNQGKAAFKNKTNTVTATPKNPTANPYIQEAIDKGLIA